jgi:hypothetical protein
VAAGGRIALPGESGMEQRFRLETEGVRFRGSRVRMDDHEFSFSKKRVTPKPRKKARRGRVD